jgi:hypothetical protein
LVTSLSYLETLHLIEDAHVIIEDKLPVHLIWQTVVYLVQQPMHICPDIPQVACLLTSGSPDYAS